MNISATIAKMNAIRIVLACAVFCATALCPAQETARGIVAEEIGTEKNNAERAEPELRFQQGHSDVVTSVAWSPDGKYIASGSWDNKIKIWDARSGKELRTLEGHYGDVISVAWSPDGKYIASGSRDNTMKVWYSVNGTEIRTIWGLDNLKSVAWLPDGKYIASVNDNTVKLWDANSYKELHTLSGHYQAVAWSPDGKYMVSIGGEYGENIIVWDVASGNEIRSFYGNSDACDSVAWSPDGKYIVGGCLSGKIIIFDTERENKIRSFSENSKIIDSIVWAPNGKYIASTSNSTHNIKVWDAASGKKEQTLSEMSNCEGYAAWSADSKYIANIYNHSVKIWEVASGKEVRTLSGVSHVTFFVIWSPDGKYIASDSDDNTVKLWDAASGKETCTLLGHSSVVLSAVWSPDGKYIASGSDDNTVKLWDAANGKEVRTLSGHSNGVFFVAWSPDGKYIASCSYDNTAKVWDAINGKEVYHSRWTRSITWSPNGKHIATVNMGTIRVWDAISESEEELLTLSGHSHSVKSVSWSPDDKHIVSGSQDRTLKIWDAQNGTLLSTTINGKDEEWLIYTPEGFFCGSEWATQNLVYIVDGMDVIGIDQVYDTYYRPDLVAAKMRGEDISAYASSVRLASLVRSGRAPAVSLLGIPAESSGRDITFDISVRNTGGGIGAVNLLLNGKSIRLSDGVTAADGETISFRHTVTLQNGSNTLEAFALNGAGLVESVRSSAQVVWRGATEKPDLYVLTAAVNRYRDKSLWLNYAVPDAQSVAAGFQKQKSGLYRNVHVSQLNDSEVTKEKLAAEFSRLSQHIRADDVFVFFVSGHGTTYDDGDYYYLPSDFRYTSKDSIPNGGISKNDLLANLSKIKAGKTLVMLDTCNSGAFLSDSNKRGLSEKTAIDRLTRATGHATLAASSDTQSAMEGYNGHGVFTYVFLEGIAGAADSDGDGYVTLNELSTFVEREVPERSYEKWGYEQVPQKDLRRQDFPIAGK